MFIPLKKQFPSQNQVLQSLAKFFSLIATNAETSPSFHAVFENVPVIYLPIAVNYVTNNSSIPDAAIETLIGRMIRWPLSEKLGT